MPWVLCNYCRDAENLIYKTENMLTKSKLHFHDNKCRLAYQAKHGFYGTKPDHSLVKRLEKAGEEYRRKHPPSPFRKMMTRQ